MSKKLWGFVILLIITLAVSIFLALGYMKKSNLNGKTVIKIEVKQLKSKSDPVSLMTLSDKASIGTVLLAINRAEIDGMPRMASYDQYGTSTHLLEIYSKDDVKEKIYIALGPNNQGTICYKDNDTMAYMINDKDTKKLRELILKIK
jgi:hypothetical protein